MQPLDIVILPHGYERSSAHSSSISEEASAPISGAWEPLDPWLLLDAKELASVSQTCRTNLKLVSAYTPMVTFSAAAGVSSNSANQASESGPDNRPEK